MPWKTPPVINEDWKRNVAADMLDSLSESRSVIFLLYGIFFSDVSLMVLTSLHPDETVLCVFVDYRKAFVLRSKTGLNIRMKRFPLH